MRKNAANLAPEQASEIIPTPVSGVRATLKLAGTIPPPFPHPLLEEASRVPFDSVDRTHVKQPTPALLAIARGEIARGERSVAPSRRTWFTLGMVAGAALMWLAIGNVRPAFEATRAHATDVMKWVEGRP